MRKIAPALMLLLSVMASGHAQDRPHWEVFGGYSFLHADAGPDITIPAFAFGEFPTTPQTISPHQNAPGWQASVEENVNSWFGAVMDFSGDYANRTVDLTPYGIDQKIRTNLSAYPFLFGPQFSFRRAWSCEFHEGLTRRGVHHSVDIEPAIAASTSGTIRVSCLIQTTALGVVQAEREVKVR